MNERASRLPACPVCVTWTCDVCHVKRYEVDHRVPQTCAKCGGTEGTATPVIHYNRDKHDEHAATFRQEEKILPFDPEKIGAVVDLVSMIGPYAERFGDLYQAALFLESGSPRRNATINEGHDVLRKIESTIRSWVAEHPEE